MKKNMKTGIAPDVLRQLLRYEPDTGKLYWLPRGLEWFCDAKSPERIANSWNTRHSGGLAFKRQTKGYFSGTLLRQKLLAHRVIFAHHHGKWPEYIDHADGNPSNNRIENLRDVSHQKNMQNMPVSIRNKSGIMGVGWRKNEQKWAARITVDGRRHSLGYYHDKNEAIVARKNAEIRFGFHQNHGRTRLMISGNDEPVDLDEAVERWDGDQVEAWETASVALANGE